MLFFSFQIYLLLIVNAQITASKDARNLQNHRNSFLDFKDTADYWIGYPKSSITVTSNTTPPTTRTTFPPPRSTKKPKKKKNKKSPSTRRRYDTDDDSDYAEQRNKENFAFQDFDYDYDGPIDPPYGKSYAPSPYIIRSSTAASAPKAFVHPSVSSTNSQTMKAIFAGTPKIATYVVPDAKKYVVQRVKSQLVYVPPVSIPPNPAMYTAASNSGMRRLDPLDYDDNGGSSFLNQGAQESFPPRPVMSKITQPGQRQPCHGPDCHQHHKGLVRFYWRRVVYPPGRRRPRGGRNRRRFRDGGSAPSQQKDVIYDSDEDPADEVESGDTNGDNDNEEEEDEEEEEEDNEENDSRRRNAWKPGKAYGHDFNEGYNYGNRDRRIYRDKRYAYRKYRKRRRKFYDKNNE